MAGIYHVGTPWDTPWEDGIAAGIEVIRQTDQDDIREQGIYWTPEHQQAGQYIVKIETG